MSELSDVLTLRERLAAGKKSACWINVSFHASRLASLFGGHWAGLFFPRRIHLGNDGISTRRIRSILFWKTEEDLISYKRVFGIKHSKGLLWDSVTITSAGDANGLTLEGLPKSQAKQLVRTIQKKL